MLPLSQAMSGRGKGRQGSVVRPSLAYVTGIDFSVCEYIYFILRLFIVLCCKCEFSFKMSFNIWLLIAGVDPTMVRGTKPSPHSGSRGPPWPEPS